MVDHELSGGVEIREPVKNYPQPREKQTYADKIRTMTDEELACFIVRQRFSVINKIADKFGIDVTSSFIAAQKNVLDLLKQEVSENG